MSNPINKMFQFYNAFIQLTFRAKGGKFNIPQIQQMARKIGVTNLGKNAICEQYFRNKETGGVLKEKLVNYFCKVLNEQNSIILAPQEEVKVAQ